MPEENNKGEMEKRKQLEGAWHLPVVSLLT
ncbi:hypothetical protein SAMN05192533_12056 [Mesobacillus persicus]|uniref:Uncharacterized protein n=1 Tax=Mesobacillus persicus TaxID=930146 RepID=A0A1H8JAN2_9BACI|nr:hypothetical protein SAMN05192533_12056 [Mesobacillus persicus]